MVLSNRSVTKYAQVKPLRAEIIPGEDPVELARWIASVCQGIAVQAAGGATRDQLHAIADRALKAWP